MPSVPLPGERAELIERTVAFQGYFRVARYLFRHSLYKGGQSGVVTREVFERGQVAAVLPYDPARDEVVLIRQFRAGSQAAGRHPWGWEIVAGVVEEGETPPDVARREAIEEASLEILDLVPLHSVVLSPGACSEVCSSFIGRVDATGAGGIFGLEAENEDILVKVLPFAEARALLDRDEVDNAPAVMALQWLALHRDELRNRWR
ncbi:NUDIX domain-containing protein [Reyranella aquatilis]|uniref:ADP-ribose pyrophosphatase n=1 Tax=Reyranella aquatilis TaxID=2035356 RepID=A0ABS8KNL6_9HYPH|nr:NUDIX domain-containing protein [Reyranella aquatilis]MCC8427634.1 NUDIX domain-containing protein [Reyranella aquatilis]